MEILFLEISTIIIKYWKHIYLTNSFSKNVSPLRRVWPCKSRLKDSLLVRSISFCLNLESGLFYKMMICTWNSHRLLISSEMIRSQKPGQWNAYTLPTLEITFQIENKGITVKLVQVYLLIRLVINFQNSAQISALQFQKRRRIECFGQPKTYFGLGPQEFFCAPKLAIKALIQPRKVTKRCRVNLMKTSYSMELSASYQTSMTLN